jgi:hypothetical protein
MNDDVLTDIVQQAFALIEADRKVVKAVVESQLEDFPKYLAEFRDSKLKVLKSLGQYGVIDGVSNEAKEVLRRAQRKFPSDHIWEQFSEEPGDEAFFYTLSEAEISDLGSDLLYSWISHYEYVRDIFKVNSIILQTSIPKELATYVREARDCFAFQQHNAVVSMCRTILEAAAKDLCEKQGFFMPHGENVITINPKVFNQLISAVSRGALKQRAVGIYYSDGCPVVHGDRSINADEALRVLRETLNVVQELYTSHETRMVTRKKEAGKEPA